MTTHTPIGTAPKAPAAAKPAPEVWERSASNPKVEIERNSGRMRTAGHQPGCVPTPAKVKP